MKKLLFLCTGNSCRSIMAEAALNYHGAGKFEAFSAGSHPTGHVHPGSIKTLAAQGMVTEGLESKSWDKFVGEKIDIVITVCDNAAGEVCPIFYGAPVKSHWGVPDPAYFKGSEKEREAEFLRVFKMLEKRILAMLELPVETMESAGLKQKLDAIGQI